MSSYQLLNRCFFSLCVKVCTEQEAFGVSGVMYTVNLIPMLIPSMFAGGVVVQPGTVQ